MTIQKKFDTVLAYFSKHMPNASTELAYKSPYQLLLAVVLSAQCTDKRVNMVTPALFQAFPNPKKLAESSIEKIYQYIKSISYPNNKAKYLHMIGKLLLKNFQGKVPANANDLQTLPGVGRKTAHVIASVLYSHATMPVDTHIFRVSKRIGLVNHAATTPLAVEKQLVTYIPAKLIPKAHTWLILHGRYTCIARKPKCEKCAFTSFCSYFKNNNKNIFSI